MLMVCFGGEEVVILRGIWKWRLESPETFFTANLSVKLRMYSMLVVYITSVVLHRDLGADESSCRSGAHDGKVQI